MTTQLIPPEELANIRAMKGLAYVLIVMIALDKAHPGRAFRPAEVALIAGQDVRTVETALKNLSAFDRVLLTTSGYVLTRGGRALFLEYQPSQDLALTSPALSAGTANQDQALENNTKIVEIIDTHNLCALKKKEESLNLRDKESSSSESDSSGESAQNVWPSVRAILEATPMLFGKPGVFLNGLNLDSLNPRIVLGWVALAWDGWPEGGNNGNIKRPGGVVYKNLADPDQPRPRAQYYNGGWNVLPDEFLEVLGMIEYACEVCDARFGKRGDLQAHVSTSHPQPESVAVEIFTQPDSSVVERIAGHMSAEQAWKSLLGQLQSEMPKASFDTWVRDTRPVHFENNILSIGARNTYACDWLESRLQRTIERLLVGILNDNVTVKFVVDSDIRNNPEE